MKTRIIIGVCWILIICGIQAHATTQTQIEIKSFEVGRINPDSVDIELTGSNSGVQFLCLGAIAKSRDGSIRSPGFIPQLFPVGKDIRISTRVLRPAGLEKPETAFLTVWFYECGKNISSRFKFEWTFTWPLQPVKPGNVDADKKPWGVFYENMEDLDYEALDLLMEKWNDSKQRDINGEWKLDGYRGAIYLYSDNRNLKEYFEFAEGWKKTNPKSVGAVIAEASYWHTYAWKIRDYKNEQDEDPVALKIFNDRLKRADQLLLRTKKYASNNPLWYKYSLQTAIALKKNISTINGIFNEAVIKYPNYQPLYEEMNNYWAPTQGKANWSKVDEIINLAVDKTAKVEGEANYAWLYSQVFDQQRIEFDVFRYSNVSWKRMKGSYEELVQRYPSAYNLNRFAMFACKAEDKATFLNLRPRIRDNIIKEAWPSNYSVDLCDHRFMSYS